VASRDLGRALQADIPRVDVVHVHSLYLFPTAIAGHVARRCGVPYVVRPHGTLDPVARRHHPLRTGLYDALVEMRNLRGAARVHFTSETERARAARIAQKVRSVVVPLGVRVPSDAAAMPDASDPEFGDRPIVLFLGRLDASKGLDVLVPAFAKVVRVLPTAHLLVVGPDDAGYGRQVRRWIDANGLRGRVTMADMLTGSEKWRVLRRANVVVLPSYGETYGMAATEAMAAGVPVVVSDRVDVAPDVSAAGAGLVVPVERDAVARAILSILRRPDEAKQMGLAGQTHTRRWLTWERAAAGVETMYLDVLGEQGGVRPAPGSTLDHDARLAT
jgi:glycosyltransferase involved in cell wall biosynthesis